jgi:hypothetical protein
MDPNEPATTLTKRELFAALAMGGLLADSVPRDQALDFAIVAADGLIDRLNNGVVTP